MNPLDFIDLTNISLLLMIIGALGIIFLSKPLDKVIMLSLLEAGFFGVVVVFKYLDVAFIIALLSPISIIIFLMSFIKINEIRSRKDTSILQKKVIRTQDEDIRNQDLDDEFNEEYSSDNLMEDKNV
ncbi:MAG: EhaD family protein [Methanobrevibacter sp.]|nr:EhaD family protein [Candidatus Methanoflexus mossambicus]